MGRLTYKNRDGKWGMKGVRWEALYEGNTISKDTWQAVYGALCKLKDYEETGLTPSEVERLTADSDQDAGNGNVGKTIVELQGRIALCECDGFQYQVAEYYEALKVAVAALKTQLAMKQNGWIPAKDRVPEDSDEIVLVQATGQVRKNILLEDALILAQYYKGEWFLEQYPMADVDVVAWQPLPEPYKAEKE